MWFSSVEHVRAKMDIVRTERGSFSLHSHTHARRHTHTNTVDPHLEARNLCEVCSYAARTTLKASMAY